MFHYFFFSFSVQFQLLIILSYIVQVELILNNNFFVFIKTHKDY